MAFCYNGKSEIANEAITDNGVNNNIILKAFERLATNDINDYNTMTGEPHSSYSWLELGQRILNTIGPFYVNSNVHGPLLINLRWTSLITTTHFAYFKNLLAWADFVKGTNWLNFKAILFTHIKKLYEPILINAVQDFRRITSRQLIQL